MKFKKSQSGRSMVEMLGVLAIIGVLSVGGIAGYSLSMRRHRANQIVDAASKFALIGYSRCLKKMDDAGSLSVSQCNSFMLFEDTDIGSLPSGVNEMLFFELERDKITGVDTTIVRPHFTDEKLCQAVASIAGSYCEQYTTGKYLTLIRIKQD